MVISALLKMPRVPLGFVRFCKFEGGRCLKPKVDQTISGVEIGLESLYILNKIFLMMCVSLYK